MPDMDTSKGQVHLICPSGIGDVAWIWSKLWKVHEQLKSQGRELIWHFPDTGDNRVHPYCGQVGMIVGEYLRGLRDFREFICDPQPEDFETGGAFFINANTHIEAGKPLHSQCPKWGPHFGDSDTFCPWLPFKNPAPEVHAMQPNTFDDTEKVLYLPSKPDPYIMVHVGPRTWMGQNWFPGFWARWIKKLEEVAPVKLMAYTPCDGDYWKEVVERLGRDPEGGYCVDQPYSRALSWIVNSTAYFGIDDGMAIMSIYYGIDTFRFYPDWLHKMPGTWEDNETLHPHTDWCLMEEMMDGKFDKWVEGIKA